MDKQLVDGRPQLEPLLLRKREALIDNLAFLYDSMRATEGLLRMGAAMVSGTALGDYFHRHLKEETGHADWMRDDLATAGVDVGERVPHPMAVAMVGSVYYDIFHVHAAGLLGHMMVIEGNPTSMRDVKALEKVHGPQIMRTIRYHAIHDREHGPEIIAMTNALPDGLRAIAINSAHRSANYLTGFMAQLKEKHDGL